MAKTKEKSPLAAECDKAQLKFQKAKAEYHKVRENYFNGKASKKEFEAAIKKVDVTHEGWKDSIRKLAEAKLTQQKKSTAAVPAAKPSEVKPTAPTFTVMAGRNSKTFATKAEAKAYEKECRKKTGKKHEIKTSKKKPSHKVVSFTAKSK